jgi:hypothetical protein
MPAPTQITVSGVVTDTTGALLPGARVVLTSSTLLTDGVTGGLVVPAPVVAVADEAALVTFEVAATDDPAFTPSGWSWRVEVTAPGVRFVRYVPVPYDAPAGTLTLGDLLAADQPTGDAATLYATIASLAAYVTEGELTAELAEALAAYLPLTGGTVAGNLAISDLTNAKSYRFRTTGGGLDNEAAGASWILSVWSAANYTGTQRTYLRMENGVQLAHMVGRWIGAVDPDTGTFVFDSDPTAGTVTTGSKNASPGIVWAARKDTAGAPTTGTWALHDVVMSTTGLHRCTVAGTPGTWVTL